MSSEERDQKAAELADLAYARSEEYTWNGEPVTWASAHNWLARCVLYDANYCIEENALAMMWIGTHPDIRGLRRQWRLDKESVYDELELWLGQFNENSPETDEAITVGLQIRQDITASVDDVDTSEGSDDGLPKKSQPAPAMNGASEPLPD